MPRSAPCSLLSSSTTRSRPAAHSDQHLSFSPFDSLCVSARIPTALAEAQEGEADRPADVDPASQPGAAIVMDLRERQDAPRVTGGIGGGDICRCCRPLLLPRTRPTQLTSRLQHFCRSTHIRPTKAVLDPEHPERASALRDYSVRSGRGACSCVARTLEKSNSNNGQGLKLKHTHTLLPCRSQRCCLTSFLGAATLTTPFARCASLHDASDLPAWHI
jgi:hypothetical protein